MSFWDATKKVASASYEGFKEDVHKKTAEIEKYKAKYERLDDQELIQKYKTTSGMQKLACKALLVERGYCS